MREILANEPLLDSHGRPATSGYSRHMQFVWDKKDVHSSRLEEWDVYRIHFGGRYVLQLALGHSAYTVHAHATLTDLATGDVHRMCRTTAAPRAYKRQTPTNPETANDLQYFGKNYLVQFETTDKFRRLALTCNEYAGIKAEIFLMLTNVGKAKEKLAVVTPFDKPGQWQLRYLESCFTVNGYVRIEDVAYQITDGFGMLNWSRGVLPARYKQAWGGGGTNVEGKPFGFSIGWGLGNAEQATENAFFFDNKTYKLTQVQEIGIGDTYRYVDDEERFVFKAEPIYEYDADTPQGRVHCIYGKWTGRVVLEDGTEQNIPPFLAFCEHMSR